MSSCDVASDIWQALSSTRIMNPHFECALFYTHFELNVILLV